MNSKSDISPVLAMAILGLVLGVLFLLPHHKFLIDNWEYILNSLIKAQNAIAYFLVSTIFNTYVFFMILERSVGYKKQGSKLRSIKKEKFDLKEKTVKSLVATFGVLITYKYCNAYIVKEAYSLKPLLFEYFNLFVEGLRYSICFSSFVIVFWGASVLVYLKNLLKLGHRLPILRKVRNHLTLGAIGEEENSFSNEINPKWAVIPQKALNGNILVTGSIGTGKTQGTILNFAEQIFSNKFDLTPASLILDPKGSFIPEIINILKNEKALDKCVYLGDAHGNI